MKELADTFKALADETRLQMIAMLLAREELCVCDFVGALGLTQSKASRHLRYLYHAGMVRDRREGLWMHYRLSERLSVAQRTIIDAAASALDDQDRQALEGALQRWLERKGAQCAVVEAGCSVPNRGA